MEEMEQSKRTKDSQALKHYEIFRKAENLMENNQDIKLNCRNAGEKRKKLTEWHKKIPEEADHRNLCKNQHLTLKAVFRKERNLQEGTKGKRQQFALNHFSPQNQKDCSVDRLICAIFQIPRLSDTIQTYRQREQTCGCKSGGG